MPIKICCIKLSLATRVIAMVGLIASVLVLTQLSTELAEQDGNGGTASILLGLDLDQFTDSSDRMDDSNRNETDSSGNHSTKTTADFIIMGVFLLFALIYALSSAFLVWGSIVEQSWCAIPWLVCEAFTFVIQIVTLALHGITFNTLKDKWIILLSVINLFLSLYFWIVVFLAQRTWMKQRQEEKENESTSTASTSSRTIPDDVLFEQASANTVKV